MLSETSSENHREKRFKTYEIPQFQSNIRVQSTRVIRMKIVTVLGARPQFIKAAALSRYIRSVRDLEEVIVHTGQHYDENMSDVFFKEMEIPEPAYFLNVSSRLHAEMTGKMMAGIEKILLDENPDIVLVYGDTNSTLAGALAARKLNLKLAHVEAGLRSFNNAMPEEINRIITDRISDFLFCPSENAIKNLRNEGFEQYDAKVFNVGDIMKDVALFYKEFDVPFSTSVPDQFVLATLHRAENTDSPDRLLDLLTALNIIAREIPVILPIHPRTRSRLSDVKLELDPNVRVIDPVGYPEMVALLKRCALVITDSGGLQKEAYFFSKFCITVRDQTEWVELTENGYNAVVGTNVDKIIEAKNDFMGRPFREGNQLYGDGKTSEKIVEVLLSH